MATTYGIRILPIALGDMEKIVTYVAGKSENPSAAERLAIDLTAGIESLRQMPTRCPLHISKRPLSHETRKLRVANYLIFFWVSEHEELVAVARVLYARRDLDEQLEHDNVSHGIGCELVQERRVTREPSATRALGCGWGTIGAARANLICAHLDLNRSRT